jgi:hypothetical protein
VITWSDWEAIGVTKIIEEHPQVDYSPLAIELFVYGGTDEDVANLIFQKMPIAYTMFMIGNTVVEVESFGMKYNVRFSRREE